MNGPAPGASRYRFADFTLDAGQRRLWRGGDVIPLVKLNFDLLRVLVEHAPNVVQHDQLARQVWGPRRTVTPENLAKRVNLLRHALGDEAARSRYIEGVRGYGYRLIPEVARVDRVPASDGGPAAEMPCLPEGALAASPASAMLSHRVARRYVLAGALGLTVGALAIDDYRLRRALRSAVSPRRDEPHAFELYAPRSSAFDVSPGHPQPALARGGRDLAFVAPLGSTDVIWVQPLGNLDARPLRGTDRASWPFWSVNGHSIGFAANGHLKRVVAAGGAPPIDIAPLGGPYWGGAWADDDTVLFGGAAGLYRVAVSGGEPRLWTELDESVGEYSHRFPVLLPDGRRFVYLALSQAGRHAFYIGSLDDRSMKVLLRQGHSKAATAFGADGRLHLLFVGEYGELLAQPFDDSHARLAGGAVEVTPPYTVEINGSVRAGALAAGGRALVYRPRVSSRTRLVWRDRNGAHLETIPLPDATYRHPALSHDGTMLTVERDTLDDASGLWLIDGRRNQNRRLGPGQMSAWTYDDSRVVYSNVRPDGWRIEVKGIAADVPAEPLVTGFHPFVKRIRDVTREGVLFQCEIADESWLFYCPFGGEPQELSLAAQHPTHARVSPDGQWLAFAAMDAGETHIFVTTFPEPGETFRVSTFQGTDPQWRSDGRELYYVTLDQTLMAVSTTAHNPPEYGPPVPMFHVPLDLRSLALSSAYAPIPDGQRFIVVESVGYEEPRLHVRLNWESSGRTSAA